MIRKHHLLSNAKTLEIEELYSFLQKENKNTQLNLITFEKLIILESIVKVSLLNFLAHRIKLFYRNEKKLPCCKTLSNST